MEAAGPLRWMMFSFDAEKVEIFGGCKMSLPDPLKSLQRRANYSKEIVLSQEKVYLRKKKIFCKSHSKGKKNSSLHLKSKVVGRIIWIKWCWTEDLTKQF